MYILDGKPLRIDVPFQHGDIVYPPNWLRLSSEADKAAIGIHWVDDQPRPNDAFYWVTDNNDGTFSKTPKDLAQLKEQYVEQAKSSANSQLSPSDWMVIRKAEDGEAIPGEWEEHRVSVRLYCRALVAQINAAKSVEDLIAAVTSQQWPLSPDALAKERI